MQTIEQPRAFPVENYLSINPATGERIAEYPPHSSEIVEQKLRQSSSAWEHWKARPVQERAALISSLGKLLSKSQEELAHLIVQEMGKPIAQARAEIAKCALLCDYYQTHGPAGLEPTQVAGNNARKRYIRYDPLGAVLAVMPWNYPFWQVMRFAIPTLLAGNAAVLKHARNVIGCATAIEKLFHAVGFPAGLFVSLNVDRHAIPVLLSRPYIRAVTLTGSETAGVAVAEAAGRQLKKCVLELGGSDPFIVLQDADLPRAIEQGIISRTLNNGQTCIAAKRFIVHADLYKEFVEGVTSGMQALRIGDPLDEQTQLGPLARRDLRETLYQQVRVSVQQGAVLCTGGEPINRPGWFFEPTVLSDVTPEMTAFREETFGPVAAILSFNSEQEALELANRSTFGLGASIWTGDLQRGEEFAAKLESGSVFVNGITRSDPAVPFGGVKRSGFGRELGIFGLHEFVNIKSVWID